MRGAFYLGNPQIFGPKFVMPFSFKRQFEPPIGKEIMHTKTKLSLKTIFESSPVSRSQAKSLCQMFDSSSEVILDFEGLDWMGQGFAHQIFVIFRREHPDISVIPENMNEAVKKMYNHVVNG